MSTIIKPEKLATERVQVLIEEPCLVFKPGETTPVHAETGEQLELAGDVAYQVVAVAGRGFYVNSADDKSKAKRWTALQEDRDRIACKVKALQEARRERAERAAAAVAAATPMSVQTMAVAVAQAVAEALAARDRKGTLL